METYSRYKGNLFLLSGSNPEKSNALCYEHLTSPLPVWYRRNLFYNRYSYIVQ